MSFLTVSEARPRIAAAAHLCESDTRVPSYINRAVRRLLPKGKWVNTYQNYRICVSSDCITWPRQIETIEAAAVCSQPIQIRNSWYEFLGAGPGIQNSDSALKLVDRGTVCAFDDITAGETDRKIRVYADVDEGAGKTIILQGYDNNAQWIRTQDGSTWIDGEKVAIPTVAATPTLSTKYFTQLVRVIKPVTNSAIRLYEYNTTTAANVRALAYYEPDEKLPSYRRSYLPSLSTINSGEDCESAQVDVAAKLRYFDVSNENDFILIGNLPALEEEVRALCFFENRNFPQAYAQEKYAVQLLQEELSSHLGDGPVVQLRIEAGSTFGAGSVANAI